MLLHQQYSVYVRSLSCKVESKTRHPHKKTTWSVCFFLAWFSAGIFHYVVFCKTYSFLFVPIFSHPLFQGPPGRAGFPVTVFFNLCLCVSLYPIFACANHNHCSTDPSTCSPLTCCLCLDFLRQFIDHRYSEVKYIQLWFSGDGHTVAFYIYILLICLAKFVLKETYFLRVRVSDVMQFLKEEITQHTILQK